MKRRSRESVLGKRIAASRLRRGLTQAIVSRRAGLDPSYWSRIETGKVHPTVRTATRIARALRLPLGELLGPSPPEEKNRPCPVSVGGRCLLELIGAGSNAGRDPRPERYSPRQVRLLRRFARVVQQGDQNMLKALDVLIGEISGRGAGRPGTARSARRR
jgi:DNA-binding XRE family transcriptional regulator